MIIGITGTLGAGKGTVVGYLVERHGYRHYSSRAFLAEELERRGLVANRDTMTALANELRAAHGPGYIAEEQLRLAQRSGGDAVLESIRSVGEAEYLKSHGAKLWAVDADVKLRYARIVERASETDFVSFEKFVADEAREFANPDPTKQNISGVIALSDALLRNDGSKEELYAQVESALRAS